MLTASLYTNLVFFILFQHYFSVLSNEVNAAGTTSASDDVFGNVSSSASQSDAVDGGAGRLPVFPERTDAVYFLVAVVGGAKMWGRMLAKTLQDLGPPFNNPHGPPLRPIYLDMPQNGRWEWNWDDVGDNNCWGCSGWCCDLMVPVLLQGKENNPFPLRPITFLRSG